MKNIYIYAFLCLFMIGCEVLNIHTITIGIHKGSEESIVAGAIAFGLCIIPLITNSFSLVHAIKEHMKKTDVVR